MGTTAVPRRIPGTLTAATASAVSASSPAVWGNQIDPKPSVAAASTRATTASTVVVSAPPHTETAITTGPPR